MQETLYKKIWNETGNQNILETIPKMMRSLVTHRRALCSVSGGSDSDIMIDLIERLRYKDKPVGYVFYDTGIEYEATHRHLDDLEKKYEIKIVRKQAKVPSPAACKKHGQPFFSKTVSENIARLQRHNFQWKDKPFDALYSQYPNCKSALRWWCDGWGEKSSFNIARNKLMKEYMIAHPPQFEISPKCCDCSKKHPAHEYEKEFNADLNIIGVRRCEGGARATAYTNCFSIGSGKDIDEYRPLFYWTDADKKQYKEICNVRYSDAYEVYGLKRTGCAGCPFGSGFEDELKVIDAYEPKLSIAVRNVFNKSYEYMRGYRAYKEECCNA